MSLPTPLPRLDPTMKPLQPSGISPKISQLHQIYTQPLKIIKQQQDDLNKKLKQSKHDLNITPTEDKCRIPKRLLIDSNLNGNGKETNGNLNSVTTAVNNKFENLNSKNSIKTDGNDSNIISNKKSNGDLRELNLESLNFDRTKVNGKSKEEAVIDVEGRVCPVSTKDVKECVGVARRAFKSYRTRSLEFREKQLKGLLKFLENHKTEIEEALYKDLGKHRQETNISEIELVANDLRYTLMKLKKWVSPEKPGKRLVNILDNIYVYNDPYGVVLIIGAWNYPILLTLGPLVGAMAGGNTIILKPSEHAPATRKLIMEVLTSYLDQECFQVFFGGVFETIELLKERFDYIFFTGSSTVGQTVYQAAAQNLTPCTLGRVDVILRILNENGGQVMRYIVLKSIQFPFLCYPTVLLFVQRSPNIRVSTLQKQLNLPALKFWFSELGGKCPVYIDETADMQKTAKRVLWGRMLNSGQTCVAPDYILCTKEVQETFLNEAQKVLKTFWGDDPSKSNSLSRIVTENHYKRLLEFMKTEQIALGGQVNQQKLVIGPTILIDVNPHSKIMEEEIFGPILPIINTKDAEEAIDFINSREKPLALYVFSEQKKIHNLFLKKTSSGGVSINDTISHIGTENLPFGGVGMSGLGSYHGKYGFDTFTHKKGVLVKDFSSLGELAVSVRYPPYSDKKTDFINFILKKRRYINFGFLDRVLIFCLGIVIACVLQYYLKLI